MIYPFKDPDAPSYEQTPYIDAQQQLLIDLGNWLWALVYIVAIVQGYRSRFPQVPLAAMCLNLGWEGLFNLACSTERFGKLCHLTASDLLNARVVFLLDILILALALRFGRRQLRDKLLIKYFYGALAGGLILGAALQYSFMLFLRDTNGLATAWGLTAFMSIRFFQVAKSHPNEPLSLAVAWIKLFANLSIALGLLPWLIACMYCYRGSIGFFPVLFIIVLLFDIFHVLQLHRERRTLRSGLR